MVLVYKCINRKRSIRCFCLNVIFNNGKNIITSVLSIGTASGLQSALIGLSNLFVVRYMNLFDTAAVAGIGIAQRLDKFIILPAKSFGLTMTTYVSQNIGAEKYERIRLGKQRCLILGTIVTVTMSLLVLLFSRQVVSLFNPNAGVIVVGTSMLANNALNQHGNYFTVPRAIYQIGLSMGAITTYGYLSLLENRQRGDRDQYTCHPSYAAIGDAIGRSNRSVAKYVQELVEAGLVLTEPTSVFVDGMKWNGNLKYSALLRLPEVQRRRLILFYYGELTHQQIADMEGCARVVVTKSIHKALHNLKIFLE